MANPHRDDPHLRVAHELNEEIMSCEFTKRQRKLLDLILRLSWGCNKKWAVIPKQRDFEVAPVVQGRVRGRLGG